MATAMKHSNEVKMVKLAVPHQQGDQLVEQLELTKPHSGHLRGLNLIKVCEMDFETGQVLIPRITSLTERDMLNLAPENWAPILTEIAAFFVNPEQ